jgi:hypothetical protein
MLDERPRVTITVNPRRVLQLLSSVIALLIAAHIAVQVAHFRFGHDHLRGLTPLLDLNQEHNLPSWYSGAVLLATAGFIAVIAASKHQAHDPFARHWTALAALFVYLSFDELTQVHEAWGNWLNGPLGWLRQRQVLGGVLRNLWVLPALTVAGLVGAIYLPFLRHLPGETRRRFAGSGAAYVLATAGMEMAGASYSAAGGRFTPGFMVLVTIEEGLEMGSIAVFLWAVLSYARTDIGRLEVAFRDATTRPAGDT